VVSAKDSTPVPYARIMREARGGGASAQPANAGTVTRADGTFDLVGVTPGDYNLACLVGGGPDWSLISAVAEGRDLLGFYQVDHSLRT